MFDIKQFMSDLRIFVIFFKYFKTDSYIYQQNYFAL